MVFINQSLGNITNLPVIDFDRHAGVASLLTPNGEFTQVTFTNDHTIVGIDIHKLILDRKYLIGQEVKIKDAGQELRCTLESFVLNGFPKFDIKGYFVTMGSMAVPYIHALYLDAERVRRGE